MKIYITFLLFILYCSITFTLRMKSPVGHKDTEDEHPTVVKSKVSKKENDEHPYVEKSQVSKSVKETKEKASDESKNSNEELKPENKVIKSPEIKVPAQNKEQESKSKVVTQTPLKMENKRVEKNTETKIETKNEKKLETQDKKLSEKLKYKQVVDFCNSISCWNNLDCDTNVCPSKCCHILRRKTR